MQLRQTTRQLIGFVEQESGYPVEVVHDPNLPTIASVRMARGPMPAHVVLYKTAGEAHLDYLVCYQCGFILRHFSVPPFERYDIQSTPEAYREVRELLGGPDGVVKRLGLSGLQATEIQNDLTRQFVDGLLLHLRSIPVGLRVGAWLRENYPQLRQSQQAVIFRELAEAKQTLNQEMREITPEEVYRPTQAISAAYALFWAEALSRRELAASYRFAGFDRDGKELLKIWREVPASPEHDRELVDRWGKALGLQAWYGWAPYKEPA